MHTSPASPAIRTVTPSPLDELPPDIFRQIVVTHISLREGRALTSLACVSRAFAQRMKPHMAPLQRHRVLDNASKGSRETALYECMGTLHELPRVHPAHRLELFLRVSDTLRQHFPGTEIKPHLDTMLASLQHLESMDQAEALLGLVQTHRDMPAEERALLLGEALIMPARLDDVAEADQMAMSLLRMIPPEHGEFYLRCNGENGKTFDNLVENMLKQLFERDPRYSIHRFQSLYQAMAHLPPTSQIYWMRDILIDCARRNENMVTPALIVATAQAALQLGPDQPALQPLYDLFALCLNPARLIKTSSYPPVKPRAVDPSAQAAYIQRFHARCGELMELLQNVVPDTAGKLIAGINGAYQECSHGEEMLPSPDTLMEELYGCFLKQALAFLQTLPPADSTACLLQMRLPRIGWIDTCHDDWTSSLMAAVAQASRGNDRVSLEQLKTTIGDLVKNGIDVPHHSPARNRRVLAGLAEFPEAVCADALIQLLEDQYMAHAHYDVLFASAIEGARSLPDILRSSVLAAAVRGLSKFPLPQHRSDTPVTLQQERINRLESDYPGLQTSNPDLYALMRPGYVSHMDGWALLLDAVATLSALHQADRLRQLCEADLFFDFSNNRLFAHEKAQCSMRLLIAIIGLPNDLRRDAFSSWLTHVRQRSYDSQERKTLQVALLPMLLALPAIEGKPLFDAYLSTICSEQERTALQQRTASHWKDAV